MKKNLVFIWCLAGGLMSASAQTKNGGISKEMLQQFQKEQKHCTAGKALSNALSGVSIDVLAKNYQAAAMPIDRNFSIETRKQSITNQKSSGRCWMFSGLNVLRSNYMMQHDSVSIEFSQAYLFFWDQLEKANLMLQGVIDTAKEPIDHQRVQFFFHCPINDGGTFCGRAARDLHQREHLEGAQSDFVEAARVRSPVARYGGQEAEACRYHQGQD